jgi:hypothetical protein
LATSMSLRCCDAIVTIKKESKPPNKSIPNGTLSDSLHELHKHVYVLEACDKS